MERLASEGNALWQRQITEFAVAESDPDYMYVAFNGSENGPGASWYLEPKLFRTKTGGCNDYPDYGNGGFTDVTPNLIAAMLCQSILDHGHSGHYLHRG
ncbi:MAG: hypothetical protein R3B47_11360 [Bacteroidia bacterium]